MTNIKTLITSLLFTVAFVSGHAEEGDTIKVVFNQNTATVTIPATAQVTAEIKGGAYVTLTSTTKTEEYIYVVSGPTENGSLTLIGDYKLTLCLKGVSIESQNGAAIDVECGKRIKVVLADGTKNSLTDQIAGGQKGAFYFKGHPEFEGLGTLNITGRTKHGIAAKEYLQIKRTTGTINILAAESDAIHCGKGNANNEHNYFEMNGGVVNILKANGDGVDSDAFGVIRITGGMLNVNVSTNNTCGLKSDSTLTVSGGRLNINVEGNACDAIRSNYDVELLGGSIEINVSGDGSNGIKSRNAPASEAFVFNGGYLTIDGAKCLIYVHGNDLTESESTIYSRAISADQFITRNNGDVEIFAYGPTGEPYYTNSPEVITGGNLTIHRAPWSFFHGDFEHCMTAHVVVSLSPDTYVPYDDYNFAIGAFVGDQCVGVATDGYLRIYNATSTNDLITFKAYNYDTDETIPLHAGQEVRFTPYGVIGADDMSQRVVLKPYIRGDVNLDGFVSIADVTTLVNIILGKQTEPYGIADINDDETISIADVTALVNIILGK